jgi:stage III sporulation protein AD
MIKIALFALISLVIIVVLRQYNPEYALIVAVLSGAIILIVLVLNLAEPIFALLELLRSYGVSSGLTSYILKALGICIITRFASDLCNDFGQTSLGGKVEMAGKITLLVISLPILQNILEVGLSLL